MEKITIKEDAESAYVEWLYDFVARDTPTASYHELFYALYEEPFTWLYAQDEARAADGVSLRAEFAEANPNGNDILDWIHRPFCSVLEMMIAISRRLERGIMSNDDYGNRTSQWFWYQIMSLDLGGMKDGYFDKDKFDLRIQRALNRQYDRNGHGGFFEMKYPPFHAAGMTIWMQAQEVLIEVAEDDGEIRIG